MKDKLQPLEAKSLKTLLIERFEELILSGEITAGQKLPSERELAETMGVSRPVVHEGLLELAARGLITMRPRAGAVVNDYRVDGSLAMLSTLLSHYEGQLAPDLLDSMFHVRMLFELETARLAAEHRTPEHVAELTSLLTAEEHAPPQDVRATTLLYFRFHHLVALASGNLFYPLLLNSFRQLYLTITSRSFVDHSFLPHVRAGHRKIVAAIEQGDGPEAQDAMRELITNGRDHLYAVFAAETTVPPSAGDGAA